MRRAPSCSTSGRRLHGARCSEEVPRALGPWIHIAKTDRPIHFLGGVGSCNVELRSLTSMRFSRPAQSLLQATVETGKPCEHLKDAYYWHARFLALQSSLPPRTNHGSWKKWWSWCTLPRGMASGRNGAAWTRNIHRRARRKCSPHHRL